MTETQRAAGGPRPLDILRPVYLDRLRVAVNPLGSRAVCFFADRELYLSAEHPAAMLARVFLAATGADRRAAQRELVDRLGVWFDSEGDWRQAPSDPPVESIGPLPAAGVLMDVAVRGRSEAELLAQLGGEQSRLEAHLAPDGLREVPDLDPQAAFLLTRVEQPAKVSDVLHQAATGRHRTLEMLCRLHSVGLVQPASHVNHHGLQVSGPVPVEHMVQLLSQRVATDLEARPVELPVTDHRERVGELVATAAGLSHYELFGVEPDASLEEINKGFQQVARLVHARHSAQLGLPIGVLQAMFRTTAEGYLELADPMRRGDYNLRFGIDTTVRKTANERRDEQERLARLCYERGVRAVEAEQFHYAVETLRESVRLVPTTDALVLLGVCLARNPNWLRQANDFLQRALQLSPRHPGVLVSTAGVQEKLDNPSEALRLYKLALEFAPGQPEALDAVERLEAQLDGDKKKKKK
jgi:hypothetical protein